MICEDFMTNHTTLVLHRLDITVFSQLKPEWSLKMAWNGLIFTSSIIFWLHCHCLSFTLLHKTASSDI